MVHDCAAGGEGAIEPCAWAFPDEAGVVRCPVSLVAFRVAMEVSGRGKGGAAEGGNKRTRS